MRNFIISLLLCAAIAALPIQMRGQTTNIVKDPGPKNFMLCGLVLVAAIVGGGIVIYVMANKDGCCGKKKLKLERSYHDGVWVAIRTNVFNVCTNKVECFRDMMTDELALYRVTELPLEPGD